MRWFWIDRVTHLEKGKRARAVKNVTLAEEYLHDHFPGYPVMPQSLMIEGMAQTGGILSGSASDFQENIVLAKVSKATFHRLVRPGDQMIFESQLVDSTAEGHRAETRITVGGELVAESSIIFANVVSGIGKDFEFVFGDHFMHMLRDCPGFDPSSFPSGKKRHG
jgi:3-hydroxyacyl-[acyl-carrier-protein] dehydratase